MYYATFEEKPSENDINSQSLTIKYIILIKLII